MGRGFSPLIVFALIAVFLSDIISAHKGSGWGPWTSWSACSSTCGTGLAYRLRHCHRPGTSEGDCPGKDRQYQACNRQVCATGKEDYRTLECRKHNNKYYGGRHYDWEAFLNPYARCELACKTREERYYARFHTTVADGTPCKLDVDALCLDGQCLDVGCDGVLGSGTAVDQCGVCGGDSSTCRVISGIFTRTRLGEHGYHHVTTLPAGACSINITELAASRNYLALLTVAGDNILNGDRRLTALGQHKGAGTTFDYRRHSGRECPGACVFAPGPLTTPVAVKLLYYDLNPGIMYHYTVPQQTAAAVMRIANASSLSPDRQLPHMEQHHLHHQHQPNHPPHLQHRHHPHQQKLSQHGEDDGNSPSRQSPPPGLEGKGHHRPADGEEEDPRKLSGRHHKGHHKASGSEPEDVFDDGLADLMQATDDRVTAAPLRDTPSRVKGEDEAARRSGGGGEGAAAEGEWRRKEEERWRRPETPRSQAEPGHSRHQDDLDGAQQSDAFDLDNLDEGGDTERHPLQSTSVQHGPGSQGDSQAPIEYRHYYHVDSDDYRRLTQRQQENSLRHELAAPGAGGGEALLRPNIISATRDTRRPWSPGRGGGGGGGYHGEDNSVGDVPLAVSASGVFVWTISGFTACSEACGGGFQQTVVVCMKSDTRVVVMAENCNPDARPTPTTVQCNSQPCSPQWRAAEWSACSVTCGHGLQTRTVECQHRLSPTVQLGVSADRCTDRKPPVTQFCRRPACFQWSYSNWTKCSTDCGLGERTRQLTCVNGEGEGTEDNNCSDQPRPKTREICDMGSCAKGWYYTRWSKKCTPECGERSYKLRSVYCASDDGSALPGTRCPAQHKPSTRKRCRQVRPCGGRWFAGPWSECNSTCGAEAWRTRDVVCMKKLVRRLWGVVGKENCVRRERPSSQELCTELPPCEPQWFMTHWSECSQSCDTGSREREVKCLDDRLQPSLTCSAEHRPEDREPCNRQPCQPLLHDVKAPLDADRDSDSLQPLVAPPRLQESTSPNTTIHTFHRGHHSLPGHQHPPGLLTLAEPQGKSGGQHDVKGAMGDEDNHLHHPNHQHNNQRRHDTRHPSPQHHPTEHQQQQHQKEITAVPAATEALVEHRASNVSLHHAAAGAESAARERPEPDLLQVRIEERERGEKRCRDAPNARWCLFVSQSRLCGYEQFQKQCCLTCAKYKIHH